MANIRDAGFIDHNDPDMEAEEASAEHVRLSDVKQLIAPKGAELPKELADLVREFVDACELAHILYEADAANKPVIILKGNDEALAVCLQHPNQFRLAPAVLVNMPMTEYSPKFNQTVFGLKQISWSYLVEAIGLDDRLRFEHRADVEAKNPKRPGKGGPRTDKDTLKTEPPREERDADDSDLEGGDV